MELESNYLSTLSSIHPEKSLKTHEIFHPENHLEKSKLSDWIDTVSCSLTWEKDLYHIPPRLLDCPNKIWIEEVASMRLEAWLVLVFFNMEVQESLSKII